MEYQNTEDHLLIVRNNLEKLLNDKGIVICSYLFDDADSHYHKEEIEVLTSNKLKLEEEVNYYNKKLKKQKNYAYTYKKCA